MNYTYLVIVFSFLFSISAQAQGEFAQLSARTKTKMAQEEEIASENDAVFIQLMTEGVNYFEDNKFDEAIQKFEQAQNRRPINVYPPVMIEDVKLAMEIKKEETLNESEEIVIEKPKEKPIEPSMTAEERVELMYQQELAKVYENMPPKPKEKVEPAKETLVHDAEGLIIVKDEEAEVVMPLEKPQSKTVKEVAAVEETKPDVKPAVAPVISTEEKPLMEIQKELAESYPNGISETEFQEGNKVITQRVVVKDGLGDEYRKVKHSWGGVFYFKNGISISERVWKDETH